MTMLALGFAVMMLMALGFGLAMAVGLMLLAVGDGVLRLWRRFFPVRRRGRARP